ncbi:PilT/PilU family type 4a pilus ATPase [Lentisphaera profundi]|uniref:PilT/PilU family type 4a pilus ATPase n=1 Tax=Lentisphaera profundi TaxID=1658616 RepID=A0ABY7VYH0_9BACT|nr:PilT/PilU family type 4a pilus ATPase [Lentisphaera profundi]WDE97108.1 PilT/PilU family type 4a pilus ATPase [Lentisphaera profundi]
MIKLEALLARCIEVGASDLHVKSDQSPRFRLLGKLVPLAGTCGISKESILDGMKNFIEPPKFEKFAQRGAIDGSFLYNQKRFRFNLFKQSNSLSLSLRLLSDKINELQSLGVPDLLYKVCEMKNGLVIVSGSTGSGKSTTLSALIERINSTQNRHIITIEEPVEYIYESKMSLINQREVGIDTPSFHAALVDSLRQDPDVILIGEIREIDTIKTAITAAETGHLVFATVHSEDTTSAIERLISVFPADEQGSVRRQLSLSLRAIISQSLVIADGKKAEKGTRVPVCEILFANNAIKNQIATGKTRQIYSSIEMAHQEGMQTFERHLSELLKKGILSRETVMLLANKQDSLIV